MSLAYASERTLLYPGPIRRWTQLVSYTTPPAPAISFTRSNNAYITALAYNNFQLTSSSGAGWGSNVWSDQGGIVGQATFTMGSSSYANMVGMSYATSIGAGKIGYQYVNFGISMQAGGTTQIYNGGGGGASAGSWTTGTVIKFVWTASLVSYYNSNVLVSTLAKSPSLPIYTNVCFNDVNSSTLINLTI
jgi:hypothetical protein